MSEILNRLKTAIESTEILDCIDGFDDDEVCDILDLAYQRYSGDVLEVTFGGEVVTEEQLMIGACLNSTLFTHLVMIGQYGEIWNMDIYIEEIVKSYIQIKEFEDNFPDTEWWEDANEYGLTTYLQAAKFYNMS